MADTTTISTRLIPIRQEVAPTTGSTVTVNSNGRVTLLINPLASLLALTIALPSSPQDLDQVSISSTQAVTTLTMSNGTITGALISMAIATFATYVYSSTTSQWWRIG